MRRVRTALLLATALLSSINRPFISPPFLDFFPESEVRSAMRVSTFLSFVTFLSLIAVAVSLPFTIGVTYTTAPSSINTVSLFIQSQGIPSVRLPDADPTVIRSFTYSSTNLHLTIANSLVPHIATNRSNVLVWIYRHVIPYYPRAKITTISVGNDVLDSTPDLSDVVLPAINNIYESLQELGLKSISVSTTFSFLSIMTSSFPPSSARFQEPAGGVIIRPLLQFLKETNSSFLINIYPYDVYVMSPEIPIGFALFQEQDPYNYRDDVSTRVRYQNLFDIMVDSVVVAMAVSGYENIPVVVAETGWPSSTGADSKNEPDGNKEYAGRYLKGLINHLEKGEGTPLKKEGAKEVFIYELFDREGKDSGMRQWGVFYPNTTAKYDDIKLFSGGESADWNAGLALNLLVLLLLV